MAHITTLDGGSFVTTAFVIIIIVLLIYISMMVWVYKDAKQRNMEAILYLILVFFFSCCGFIIYLIARAEYPVGSQEGIYRSQEPRMNTTQQQHPQNTRTLYGQPQYAHTQAPSSPQPQNVNIGSKFCRYCGGKMPSDAKFCSICGANEFNN